MRNLEECCEETLFTQLFKCCTSPKKTTSVGRECLSHVQPWDQKSSLCWAASPTSANASSLCLLLTCPECWIGWRPWRAWNRAHFGCGVPPVRLSSPDQTDLSGSEHIRHTNVESSRSAPTSSPWTNEPNYIRLHRDRIPKVSHVIALENLELIWRVWCCDF